MAAKSFKQMIKDGDLKRADAMKARLEDLHEEPGFNLRAEGEDLEQSIADLADYLHQGGIVPALEVRPREEGGMWVVDGHRRRRAYLKLDAEGRLPRDPNGEFWVPIVAFGGNDAERVLRVITSQEGRKLSPLELAHGYKRLIAFGWTVEQIAQKMGRTRQHVDQVLVVGNANTDVQQLISSGAVAATTAARIVRKHGEKAGQVLGQQLAKVIAAGGTK
ncbi:ParB/RepB/Spo0J family partition protein, partial [Pseudomonas aeruginosa]